MFLILYISTLLFAQDVIKYPETPPINNPELLQRFKQKEQHQLLDDNYWDDGRILFSTYFGGSGYDCINDGAFDSKGNFVQVGYTGSPDLPIVGDAFQKEKNLNHDMFIVKWNPEGDVIWSTFLGGSGSDVLYSVAIDKNDDIIVAGRTESWDIKVSEDASQLNNLGNSDFYLAKFTTDGEYVWSTFWGGNRAEMQCRMVIDEIGNIYLGGTTTSSSITTTENAYQKSMLKEWKIPGEEGTKTKSGVYLAKFTPEGKNIWGTYFTTKTEYTNPHGLDVRQSYSEILTGIDVYGDEIAFSWDLEELFERIDKKPIPEFVKVTEDAEQKYGVPNAGWQTQVFKIDTAGTTLKYGTFYAAANNVSRNVKYDSSGNLYMLVGTKGREVPKKDSIFDFKEKDGYLTFVKYNTNNELVWDFGYGCSDGGGSFYNFEIDENNVLWTVGLTSCNGFEQSVNPFPSIDGPGERPGSYIFALQLDKLKYWLSYIDLRFRYQNSINAYKNNILVSGCSEFIFTKNEYQKKESSDYNVWGTFYKLNMENVFNYDTSGIDSTEKNDSTKIIFDYNYYLENDKLIITSQESINNIKLYNLNGKLLFKEKYLTNRIEINKTKYALGVYFVIINEKKILKCLIY